MDALVAIVGTEELKTRGMGRLIKLLEFEEGKTTRHLRHVVVESLGP